MSRLYLSTIFRSVIEFRGRTLLYVLVHPRLTVRQRWGSKPFAPSVPVYSFSFPSACNCFGKVCQCTVHSARLLLIWRAKQRRWKRETEEWKHHGAGSSRSWHTGQQTQPGTCSGELSRQFFSLHHASCFAAFPN